MYSKHNICAKFKKYVGEHGETNESGHSALPYENYMLCDYLCVRRKKKLGFQYEMGSKKVIVHPLQALSISVTIGDDFCFRLKKIFSCLHVLIVELQMTE